MIGYVCKYTPAELLEAMGAEMVRIEPEVTDFDQADALMHPNVCSYVKGVLEVLEEGDYEGLILTTCCDSVRRLYDVLKKQYPEKFLYLLDVPRKVNDFSVSLFEKRLWELAACYQKYIRRKEKQQPGSRIDEDIQKKETEEKLEQLLKKRIEAACLKGAPEEQGCLRVGLMGARCPKSIRSLLLSRGVKLVFDLTCNGRDRGEMLKRDPLRLPETKMQPAAAQDMSEACGIMHRYAEILLNQIPCLRMVKATGRERFLEGFQDDVDGIIYHTVKFCDMYAYEYTRLNLKKEFPILKVETDLTTQCEGQIRTRVEAFLESLEKRKNPSLPSGPDRNGSGKKEKKEHSRAAASEGAATAENTGDSGGKTLKQIYVMGVDSGSTSTNAVIMNGNREIIADATIRTGAKTAQSAEKILELVLQKAGLTREDLGIIVSTGYGRVSIPYADKNVTEISCHGKGAVYFHPQVRTILDIGGQDSKAIRLNEAGEVTDFVMNDKCAAGTGRFLEAMARTLEISIEELGPVSLKASQEVQISSMCTVFAESEVISLIAQNKEKSDIANGVHNAIAGKAYSLLKRVGITDAVMMTGGVARNPGVVRAVEKRIGTKLIVLEKPDLVGAAGAALQGLEDMEKREE